MNGDPDVDAIFRLTRKGKDVDLKVEFDAASASVVLPPKKWLRLIHKKHAVYEKGIVRHVDTNLCNVSSLRYLAWLLASAVTVGCWITPVIFPPNALQFRNAHNYCADFIDEKMLYHDAGRLVEFLINWKSDKPDFFSRALDLSIAMVEQGFWQLNDAMLTEAWLADLVSVGYEMPAINTAPQSCINVLGGEVELLPEETPCTYLRAGSKLKNLAL